MGYTHYWLRPRELDRARFAAAANDCRRLCNAAAVPLHGPEKTRYPVFTDYLVAFNGGCEDFVVQCVCDADSPERPSRSDARMHRGFCKTEHLPYEVCVQACLIALQHHLGPAFRVESDGSDEDWAAARALCERVAAYGLGFRLLHEET